MTGWWGCGPHVGPVCVAVCALVAAAWRYMADLPATAGAPSPTASWSAIVHSKRTLSTSHPTPFQPTHLALLHTTITWPHTPHAHHPHRATTSHQPCRRACAMLVARSRRPGGPEDVSGAVLELLELLLANGPAAQELREQPLAREVLGAVEVAQCGAYRRQDAALASLKYAVRPY